MKVTIEPMGSKQTEPLLINYSFARSPFGEMLIASTPRGICMIDFADSKAQSLQRLSLLFPHARINHLNDRRHEDAIKAFTGEDACKEIRLHLKGSDFQLGVWNALLRIPAGRTVTYSQIASLVGQPKACRAAGNAIAANPAALIIPCHRVVRSTGECGNYRWGPERKAAILAWEASVHPSD